MTLTKKITTALVALPLLIGSVSINAKEHKPKDMMGMIAMKVFLKDVTLTPEQKTQLKAIREENRAKMQAEREANKAARLAANEKAASIVMAASFDEAAARALAQSSVEQQINNRVNAMKNQQRMYAVLTPEQQAQVKVNLANLKTKIESKMQQKAQ